MIFYQLTPSNIAQKSLPKVKINISSINYAYPKPTQPLYINPILHYIKYI